MLNGILQDLKYALRMLRKSPGFAATAILTLALGIGANSAIFSAVQRVLLRPLPYPHAENLVEISNSYNPAWPQLGISPGDYQDWRQQARSFSDMGAYVAISTGFNMTGDGATERIQAAYSTAELFPLLGVRAVIGRTFSPEENKTGTAPVALLSHRFWLSHFGGDAGAVGKTITLDGQRFTLAGVLPGDFQLETWPDIWLPSGQYPDDLTGRVHHPFTVLARLKPGVSVGQAQSEIESLNNHELEAFPDTHKNWGVMVQRFEDPSATKLRRTLLVLFGAVGLVLLIACANIVNLVLARNASREREIALRTALGANRWRMVRQLVTESLLLSFIGGALGVLLASVGLAALTAALPADLAVVRDVSLNGPVLAFTLGICVLTGVACGLLPALQTLRADLGSVIKQGTKGSSGFGSRRAHDFLVISEIAMALLPLIGAGLLLRSFHRLVSVSAGFSTEHLLTMQIPQAAIPASQLSQLSNDQQTELGRQQSLQFEQLAAKIQALPGVKHAGGIDVLPLASSLRQASRFLVEGQPVPPAGARPVAQIRSVSLGYFASAGIPLLQGRGFNQADWRLTNVVINEAMARRFWPGAGAGMESDALGKRINVCSLDPQPCWFSIIGIVGNVHQFGLDAEPTLDVYFSGGWTPYLVIRTDADPSRLAIAATDVVHKFDPNLPVTEVLTMDELLSDSVAPRRFAAVLIGTFAGLALLLAAVGIYGVTSYTVNQRTREIGIRVALGAQPADVRGLILGRTMRLAVCGVALGLAGALALTRYLSSLLYQVRAFDPATFVVVSLVLAGAALAACYVPARRAMRVDPMVALRYE
jgi:putative ABC transport system permease protein